MIQDLFRAVGRCIWIAFLFAFIILCLILAKLGG